MVRLCVMDRVSSKYCDGMGIAPIKLLLAPTYRDNSLPYLISVNN